MSWGKRFEEARRRLLASADFAALEASGHALKDGVVLTSVNDAPFEMSFKCTRCTAVFWFENPASRADGKARWRLNAEACEVAPGTCAGTKPASAEQRMPNGVEMHP